MTNQTIRITDPNAHRTPHCTVIKIPENKGRIDRYEILDSIILYHYKIHNCNFSKSAPRIAADTSLHYCYSGNGILSNDNSQKNSISNGDYIIDCKNHACQRITSIDGTYIGVTVICDINRLNQYFSEFFADQDFDCYIREPYISKDGKFTSKKVENLVVDALAAFCRCYNSVDYKFMKLKTAEVFCRMYDIQKTAIEQGVQYMPRQKVNQMIVVKEYLEKHFDSSITLTDIANQHQISISTLKTSFKAVFGMPVYAYLRKIRLEKAEKMLLETRQSVTDIANKVGYSNTSKFSIAFKEYFGASPTDIRKLLSN